MHNELSNFNNDEIRFLFKIIEKLSRGFKDHITLRKAILSDVLKLLKGDSIISYLWNKDSRLFEHPVFLNLSPENPFQYNNYYRFCDPITPKLRTRRHATPVTKIINQAELERTEFFNDFLSRYDQCHGINAYAYDRNMNVGDLRIWRTRQRPDFGEHEAALLDILLPYYRNALRNVNALNDAHGTVDFWQNMFEDSSMALFFFDEKSKSVFRNNRARKMERTLSKESYHSLNKKVRALSKKDLSETEWGPYFLSVSNFLSPMNSNPMTVVMVTRSSSEEVNRELLSRKHKLSPREIDVCLLICKGLTDQEIASALEIAFSTVRTHLKRAFIKLDATNRSELISCLLEGVIDFSF